MSNDLSFSVGMDTRPASRDLDAFQRKATGAAAAVEKAFDGASSAAEEFADAGRQVDKSVTPAAKHVTGAMDAASNSIKGAAEQAADLSRNFSRQLSDLQDAIDETRMGRDHFRIKRQLRDLDDLTKEMEDLGQMTEEAQNKINTRRWQLLNQEFDLLEQSAEDAAEEVKDVGDATQKADQKSQRFSVTLAGISGAFGAVAAVAAPFAIALGAAGVGAVKTGMEFESLSTRLGTLMGSAEAGKERMEELFDFASSTPFELGEIVEAEVNLRALGVNAEAALPMVLDFAGAMGTDLASAAVEVGRAMQFGAGAVESISGRALRAQVELRTGQDALTMSTAEFREELVKTLTDSEGIFAGGTDKLAATLTGTLSNLSDEVTKFNKAVADSGFFQGLASGARELLSILEDNRAEINDMADDLGINMLAGIQTAISMTGGLYDSWLLVQQGVVSLKALVFEAAAATASFFEAQARQVEGLLGALAEVSPEFLGMKTEFTNAAAAAGNLRQGIGDIRSAAEEGAGAAQEEFNELERSMGRGAATAERLNKAIDAGRSGGRIQSRGAPQAPPPPPGAATGAAEGSGGGAAADKERVDTLAKQNALMMTQRDLVTELTTHRLSELEKVNAAELDALVKLEEIAEQRLELAGEDKDARLEIVREFEASRAEIQQEFAKRRADIEAKAVEQNIAQQERAEAATLSAASALSSAAVDAAAAMVEANAGVSKDAMMRAWRAQQALSLANVTIRVAEGLVTAATLPPPADAIKSAAVILAGATATAQIATAKPPTFADTPGVVQVQSSNGGMQFADGDFVAAARNPDDLRRQVNDMRGSDRMPERIIVPAVPLYEGRTWETGIGDATRRPGQLSRALNRQRITGRKGW